MTQVMGIVNVTPDSFSDGGQYFSPEEALRRARNLIEEGASIIDFGAESTRPGATPLAWEEEWSRLEPVLEGMHARVPTSRCPDVPISVACAIEYEGNFQKGEGSAHDLIVTPYFRYNICDIGERFSFFMDLFSGIDMLRFNIFNVGLSPGVSFDVTEHWSAEFSIGFLGYEWERIPDDKPLQSFEFGFEAAAPSFGLYYSF